MNLVMQTDAYHMTMGYLIGDPMEIETHVLYARTGGPQVVTDLSVLISEIAKSVPTRAQIADAEQFWRQQNIPFPAQSWYRIADQNRLPLTVRGLQDGEVALPGDPIAVITGPAALVGAIEPILIGSQMASMQLGTRFTKALCAAGWDAGRIFEVGLRAVDGPIAHLGSLRRLKRLGLRYTSNGQAAHKLGLRAVGTMGHRYTQRYVGSNADYEAFNAAVTKMIHYRQSESIREKLPLSFLLDTRNTLRKGLPAAISVIKDRWREITENLIVGVRLDSGPMAEQLRTIIKAFKSEFDGSDYMPKIIIESGLKPTDIARYDAIAKELGFDKRNISYGLGGYLVGGISRDWISLVYKITSFGGQERNNVSDRTPTMKFGDEKKAGKQSYPGDFDLWEKSENDTTHRILSLTSESLKMQANGYQPLFRDLMIDGALRKDAMDDDQIVTNRAKRRWTEVAGSYIEDDRNAAGQLRPALSSGMGNLIVEIRQSQLEEPEGERQCQ